MFCQIKSFAKCGDLRKIKSSLFETDEIGDNWLNDCHVSLSPCSSLLAVAKSRRLILLNTQWDNSSNVSVFTEIWSGYMMTEVTALFTFQVSNGDSREAGNYWLCIAVGFRTGDISFYSDNGQLLLTDKFDDNPVLKIKCFTGQHNNDTDEIYILHSNSVCCLTASTVLQTLRYVRLKIAKENAISSKETSIEGHNLLNRKLGLVSQDTVYDASVIGLELSNTFDHLLTASIHGGFFTGYRSVAPHNTVIVGVGARPFVGFHQALEGGNVQPILNDVARAVASKIKSALPGWLKGKPNAENVPPPLPSAERMFCRYSLSDLHRKGLNCTTSPDRRLLATIDSLGRVLLIDVRRGTAVRMFKGYRNGQCGFLQVNEESSKRKTFGRKTLFLILYIGKQGLLEVWPLRGQRIAAFSTAQNAKLLYYPNSIVHQGSRKPAINSSLSLLLPDGEIKQVCVPFHFTLNNEERSRDIHIVKRLRQLIKEKDCDYAHLKKEIIKTIKEIKTLEMKIHCVEMLTSNKNIQPDILAICIQYLQVSDESHDEKTARDVAKLATISKNLVALVTLYAYANDMKLIDTGDEDMMSYDSSKLDDSSSVQSSEHGRRIDDAAIFTEAEMENLLHLLNVAITTELKRNHAKVTFVDDKKSTFSQFIAAFQINSDSEHLSLKETLPEETLLRISKNLFDNLISGKLEWTECWNYCSDKRMSAVDLRNLMLTYWINLSIQDITKSRMETFANIMCELCYTYGIHNVYRGYNETSNWWQSVREFLIYSSCPFKAMITAQLCRGVAKKIEKEVEKKESDSEEDMWESVSRDAAQWGLLVGKLDDISLLSIILTHKPEAHNKFPVIRSELPEINLRYIYSKGKGSISEIAAIWLCIAGVDPQEVIDNIDNNAEPEAKPEGNADKLASVRFEMDEKTLQKTNGSTAFDRLNLLKKQFPLSLDSNNIIANMCWEYVKYWSGNIEEVAYLEASLKCLKLLEHPLLRCGICAMIWSTYLIHPFESSYKLISKVGKLPKEKLTRQNIGLSDVQLLKLLEIITDFLDLFLCSVLSNNQEKLVLRFEEIWEGSNPALTEIALTKSNVNVEILQLHYQLSAAIYYQCFLGSNYWKHLVNLFDVESQKCVFGSLYNPAGVNIHHLPDTRVMIQRSTFVTRLVSKCVDLPQDWNLWIERIQDLSRLWHVNDDLVRRANVISLYMQGMDVQAEEAISSITDLKPILESFIPIAARRLKHYIDYVKNKGEIIAILTPQVTNFLQNLEEVPNELITVTSLESTIRLLEIILASEQRADNQWNRTGTMLLDACRNVHEFMINDN